MTAKITRERLTQSLWTLQAELIQQENEAAVKAIGELTGSPASLDRLAEILEEAWGRPTK